MSRAHLHAPRHVGDRASDAVAGLIGSWRFVLAQLGIIVVWFAWNTLLLVLAFDKYPFTFLNLFLSCEAAFATSLILISQNRQARIDRARDDAEAREVEELHAMNRTQLSMLAALTEALDAQAKILDRLDQSAEQHAAMLQAIHHLTQRLNALTESEGETE